MYSLNAYFLFRGDEFCVDNYIRITRGSAMGVEPSFDRWCGSALTDGFSPSGRQNLPIRSSSLPFTVSVHTSPNVGEARGFKIMYEQTAC